MTEHISGDLRLHHYHDDPERHGFAPSGEVRVADCEPGTIANVNGQIRRIERVTEASNNGCTVTFQTPEKGWGTSEETVLAKFLEIQTFALTKITAQGHTYVSDAGHHRCFDCLGYYGSRAVVEPDAAICGVWYTPLDAWHVLTADEHSEYYAATGWLLNCEICAKPPVAVYVTR